MLLPESKGKSTSAPIRSRGIPSNLFREIHMKTGRRKARSPGHLLALPPSCSIALWESLQKEVIGQDPTPMIPFATRESARAWVRSPQATRSFLRRDGRPPLRRDGRPPLPAAPARGGRNARGGEAQRPRAIRRDPGLCAARLDLCGRGRLRSLALARAPRAQGLRTEPALARQRNGCAPWSPSDRRGTLRASVPGSAVVAEAPRAAAPAVRHHSAARSPACSAVEAALPRCGNLPQDRFTAPSPRCPRGRDGAAHPVQSLDFRHAATGADEAAKDPPYVRTQSSSR